MSKQKKQHLNKNTRRPLTSQERSDSSEELILAQREYYSGPIPDPDTLAKYEQIHPGITEKIVAMAEADQAANIKGMHKDLEIKQELVSTDRIMAKTEMYGLFISGGVISLLIASSTFLILNGYPTQGLVGTITSAAALLASFLARRR